MSEATKAEFLQICHQNITREGVDKLLSWLEKTDFFDAPASTKYHGAHRGGLCEHSINVFKCLQTNIGKYPDLHISAESVAITALFHDLCKVGYYKLGSKNVKNENGQWEKVSVYEVDEKFPCGDHADKSIIILQSFIRLTTDEILAIRAHMGGWDNASRGGSRVIGNIFDKSPFAVLMHLADMEATYLLESRK